MHQLDKLLPEICQLLDNYREDFKLRGIWTEWDQSVRDRITAYNLSRLSEGKTLLERAYEAGWVQCAIWADRDDLITDCDSGAYARERDAALTKLSRCEDGSYDGVTTHPEFGEVQS